VSCLIALLEFEMNGADSTWNPQLSLIKGT
jgi:hypothetical protein